MAALFSAFLLLLFLGLPFYWGTLGHGIVVPIAWAIAIAAVVNVRHQRSMNQFVMASFALTLVMSLITCTVVFLVGRVLSR